MTSAVDVLETVRGSDGVYRARKGAVVKAEEGSVVQPPQSLATNLGGMEALVAALLGGGGSGGLSFDETIQLEQLRNQGDLAVTGLSGSIQQAIARLQEDAETGRFLFGTKAEARQAAQDTSQTIISALSNLLGQQGFVAPVLAGAIDPAAASAALVEALREGTVFPTLAREQLIAQAASNPADIIGLLAMTAGRDVLAGDEASLQERLAFNAPKLVEEGTSARGRLASQLEGADFPSFQDLLDQLLPLVEPPALPAAINVGGGGGGGFGGAGGAGATGAAPAPALSDTQRGRISGGTEPSRGAPSPVRPNAPDPEVILKTVTDRGDQLTNFIVSHPDMTPEQFRGMAQGIVNLYGFARPRDLEAARVHILEELTEMRRRAGMRTAQPTNFQERIQAFSALHALMFNLSRGLDPWLGTPGYERTPDQGLPRRPGLYAKGGRTFEPGFFLVGDKGDGIKKGTAEFAYLPPGAVIAPMARGDKPDMDTARRAVHEMITHGKRLTPAKKGALVRLQAGGYVVQSGDSLWAIIQARGGDPARWREVATAIGLADPRNLQVGAIIPWTVLATVGASVPAPPPAPAASAPAPAPTAPATSAPETDEAINPEQETIDEIAETIKTLLGPSGLVSQSLAPGRSITEILSGFSFAPNRPEFESAIANVAPNLQTLFSGSATQLPYNELMALPDASRSAIMTLLGQIAGSQAIPEAILGLRQRLQDKAFAGNQQLALTR